LRESGAIEQDADLVIFIHRPEKYGLDEEDGISTKGLAQIIIAKHRNGAVTDVNLRFIESYAKFTDYDQFYDIDTPISGGASITVSSKMNKKTDDIAPNHSFDNSDEVPN
jgi:replicative DNA helicase